MTTMVYNSDNFVVVELDVPVPLSEGDILEASDTPLSRGGYEIVDKFARKEIFIEGALAERFQRGVHELVRNAPGGASPEALDDYIAGFTELAQNPLVLH